MIKLDITFETSQVNLIPGIRSELAKELLKLGMKQKEISKILNITQPAVSQYISDKRGHGIKFNDQTMDLIKKFALELKEGRSTSTEVIQRTCRIILTRQSETGEIFSEGEGI